jgi:hypothetical protein
VVGVPALSHSDIRIATSGGSVVAGTSFSLVLRVWPIVHRVRKPLPGATVDI